MRITLQNIGQVKNAEIDLNKDLIVLCGPNNTGKTYAAYSVYGLFSYANGFVSMLRYSKNINIFDNLSGLYDTGFLKINLKDNILSKIDALMAFFTTIYVDYLPIVFATNPDMFEKSAIGITLDKSTLTNKIYALRIQVRYNYGKGLSLTMNKEAESYILELSVAQENSNNELPIALLSDFINEQIIDILYQKIIFTRYYIAPAERVAINIFSKEISVGGSAMVDKLLENKEKNGVVDVSDFHKQISRYPLPIKDSLFFAENLEYMQNIKGDYKNLAEQMEKTILQGKIGVLEQGQAVFSPKNTDINLSIHLTASIVKSLANIVFYCKHIAKPNDFLIIDEPELNLHPDNQRKMARIIAQMVNAGIKVMISTHSDYIIRELNNLMMLNTKGADKEVTKLMKKYGYKKEQLLDHNRVGAYLFTQDVKALEVSEVGFEVKTIDDEINQLNEASEDIYLTLHNN